jgi:hypothetical protein
LASRSTAGPYCAGRRGGKAIAARDRQSHRIDLGIGGKPPVDIIGEARIIPDQLVDQLEQNTRTELMGLSG